MPDMATTAVEQLMQHIRNQDELIHRWTATLVTTQGGLLAGAGILWNASGLGIHSKGVGTLLLAVLAIPIAWACSTAIRSESRWQGQCIIYLQGVTGNDWLYKSLPIPTDDNGNAQTGGVIVTCVGRVAVCIYALWILLAVSALAKVVYWSPYL